MHSEDGPFDERVAARYDADTADQFAPEVVLPAVDRLAALAGGGCALELGIGTGRIALPLARRGVEVHGIERSRAMLARLRGKPGGDAIPVTVGDFASARTRKRFALVYLVFNTIMNLTTQAAQRACFRNAAEHLESGGAFLVEVMVPELRRLSPGETTRLLRAGADRFSFDVYDAATQSLTSHHLRVVDGRIERFSIPFRYVWPAELDLMAELAGLRLRSRWADFAGAPFTHESRAHVSVWEKA